MNRLVVLLAIFLFTATSFVTGQNRTYAVEDLMKVRRVRDPQLSPDGTRVALVIGDVNLDANRVVNQVYLTSLEGGEIKQLTTGERSSTAPRWSPDGKKIAYATGRQSWLMDSDGDNKEQITKISTEAASPLWSPDGKWIAFTSEVHPDCSSDDCNKKKDEEAEKSKVKDHTTNRLLFRHWNEWRDVKRTHVLVVQSKGGTARDLTAGDFDSPPYAAATGVDFAFSPDSREIAYLRNPDKVEAISTNSDIYVVALSGGPAKDITVNNRGYDAGPVYTRDGRYIIYRSQATPGFEADRWRLMSYNRMTGVSVELTKGFDQQVEEVALSPDGNYVYFTAGERGHAPIFRVPLGGAEPQKMVADVFATNLQITPDGKALVFMNSSMTMPAEVYRANADGTGLTERTNANRGLIADANLRKAEEVEWTGALGKKIHGFVVKPANFDASKKYPLLVLIHGGPQSAWNDSWSYRCNPE